MQLARDLHTSAVLGQCLQAITGADAVLELTEARWVMCRLAELLDWDMPVFAAEDAAP
jgi:hypothetical protein